MSNFLDISDEGKRQTNNERTNELWCCCRCCSCLAQVFVYLSTDLSVFLTCSTFICLYVCVCVFSGLSLFLLRCCLVLTPVAGRFIIVDHPTCSSVWLCDSIICCTFRLFCLACSGSFMMFVESFSILSSGSITSNNLSFFTRQGVLRFLALGLLTSCTSTTTRILCLLVSSGSGLGAVEGQGELLLH